MTKIANAVFCIVDIETTGLDPEKDRIVEIACVATTATEVLGMWAALVDGRPCNAETSAIHGLTDEDLENAVPWEDAQFSLALFASRFGDPIYAAHNAAFDKSFVDPESDPWLCTKRLAMHLLPSAPSHKNQVLRYWRDLKVDTFGILPHRALADCLVTAALLRDLLKNGPLGRGETVEELIASAESPVLLLNMPKGKHRGPIADVPTDYISWALGPRGMTDMDRDLRFTLETEMRKRNP